MPRFFAILYPKISRHKCALMCWKCSLSLNHTWRASLLLVFCSKLLLLCHKSILSSCSHRIYVVSLCSILLLSNVKCFDFRLTTLVIARCEEIPISFVNFINRWTPYTFCNSVPNIHVVVFTRSFHPTNKYILIHPLKLPFFKLPEIWARQSSGTFLIRGMPFEVSDEIK